MTPRSASLRVLLCCSALLMLATGCRAPHADGAAQPGFASAYAGRPLLEDALARARAENKRVLLLFGADWCPYCKALHKTLQSDPEVQALIDQAYIVVPVDVGQSGRPRNTGLIDRFQAPVFTDGIPALVIVDAHGRRLAPGPDNPWSLRDTGRHDRLMAFLRAGAEGLP